MRTAALAILLPFLLLVACGDADRSHTIDEVRSGRAPEIQRGAGLTDFERLDPRGARTKPKNEPAPQERKLVWKMPTGWKELPTTKHRKANFTLERSSELECYFSLAGGGLLPNVNRWRRQMKLEPASMAEMDKLPRHPLFKGLATYVDINGDFSGMSGAARPKQRMLGLILPLSESELLFVKMIGPEALVAEEEANFLAFAQSLGVESSAGGSVAGAADAEMHWQAPEGWVEVASRGDRKVTYQPAGNKKADCYIFAMVGDAGGLVGNINRWRRQIGTTPLSAAEIAALPTVMVLGKERPILEEYGRFTGMGGEAVEESGLLAVPCFLGPRAVFIKFTGPAQLVRDQKENFFSFCRSLSTESQKTKSPVEGKK
jgi:hypothetical protein